MQWSFQNYIMLKSSRKKLIVSGDSFTFGSNQRNHDGSIKNSQTYVWPDILAEKSPFSLVIMVLK